MILALRDDTSRHDVCRSLYGRSKARLPTGHASWPTRRGTCPIMVLTARSGRWLLPTSWPAWRAYSSSRLDTWRVQGGGVSCVHPSNAERVSRSPVLPNAPSTWLIAKPRVDRVRQRLPPESLGTTSIRLRVRERSPPLRAQRWRVA